MENRFISFVNRLSTAEIKELKDAIAIVENGKKLNETANQIKEDDKENN